MCVCMHILIHNYLYVSYTFLIICSSEYTYCTIRKLTIESSKYCCIRLIGNIHNIWRIMNERLCKWKMFISPASSEIHIIFCFFSLSLTLYIQLHWYMPLLFPSIWKSMYCHNLYDTFKSSLGHQHVSSLQNTYNSFWQFQMKQLCGGSRSQRISLTSSKSVSLALEWRPLNSDICLIFFLVPLWSKLSDWQSLYNCLLFFPLPFVTNRQLLIH